MKPLMSPKKKKVKNEPSTYDKCFDLIWAGIEFLESIPDNKEESQSNRQYSNIDYTPINNSTSGRASFLMNFLCVYLNQKIQQI